MRRRASGNGEESMKYRRQFTDDAFRRVIFFGRWLGFEPPSYYVNLDMRSRLSAALFPIAERGSLTNNTHSVYRPEAISKPIPLDTDL